MGDPVANVRKNEQPNNPLSSVLNISTDQSNSEEYSSVLGPVGDNIRPKQKQCPSSSSSGRHPVYRGIRCRSGKWVSEIREPRKSRRIWLGTYPTPEMAAAAYDVAALALKGSNANLNFPDSVLPDSIPESPTPDDIRSAAANAAASRAILFQPQNTQTYTTTSTSSEQGALEEEEFIDEEALFDMPNLLMNMAEGMLVSPPRMNSDDCQDNSEGDGNLWSYPR